MQIKNTSEILPKIVGGGRNLAFTLVELIIVITILAILATIAFISFQSYTKSARDSSRMSTLTSLDTWLRTHFVKTGKYPIPEKYIEIQADTNIIWYQWQVWENISQIIKASKTPIDPLDTSTYTYLVNANQNAHQLLWYLENPLSFQSNEFISTSYASQRDVKNRYIFVKWDELWVLLVGSGSEKEGLPLHELYNPVSFTGIDIQNFSGTINSWENIGNITVIVSETASISWTGSQIYLSIQNNYADTIQLVFAECPVGWMEVFEVIDTAVGAELECEIWKTCKVCQSPNINTLPANTPIMMDSCPIGWTQTFEVMDTAAGADIRCSLNDTCKMCQAHTNTSLTSEAKVIMPSCRAWWNKIYDITDQAAGAEIKCSAWKNCEICQKN